MKYEPILAALFLGSAMMANADVLEDIEPGTPPAWHFETETHADGSHSLHLVFETVAGVSYRVETSLDLMSWGCQPEDQWYGLGHEIVIPMVQTVAPPEPPEPPIDPPPPRTPASLLMRTTGGNGLLLSWRSLDDSSSRMHHFPGLSPATAWSSMFLCAESYGDYDFFIWHTGCSMALPAEPQVHGPKDTAMLEDFETNFPAMNQSVIDAEARARLLPPPAPPAGGAKKFWRITADWGLDTDMDGSADWLEFAAAANAPPGNPNVLADAMNGDANENGTLDGFELDSDQDGLPDVMDAVPGEKTIAWQPTPPTRFAMFPVAAPTPPEGEDPELPLQTNNQGYVLFPTAIWKEGATLNLPPGEDPADVTSCKAWGMNNLGEILGVGSGAYYHRNNTSATVHDALVYAYWSNHTADPVKVALPEPEDPLPPTAVPDSPEPVAPAGSFYPHDCLIDDAGRFYAWTEGLTAAPWARHSLWREFGGEFIRSDAEDYLLHVLAPDHGWGPQTSGTKLIGSAAHDFETWYPRFATLPSGGLAAFSGKGTVSEYQHAEVWVKRFNFAGAVDCTTGGVIPYPRDALWWNGKRYEIKQAAPELPQPWESDTLFLDAAPAGWIVARRETAPTPQAALLAPIRLEDNQHETGIDTMSLQANDTATGYQEKAWIMAPEDSSNRFDILTPACPTGRITIEAGDGYRFGIDPVRLLSDSQETIDVWGDDGAESQDTTLTLKMGNTTSLSSPLGVKVMKRREIRVAIWGVASIFDGEDPDVPDLMIDTDVALEDHLDPIFREQINTTIDVILHPVVKEVDWDENNPNDHILDTQFDPTAPSLSAEMNTIKDEAYDESAQIQVYLLGGRFVLGPATYGHVTPETNSCWIHGDAAGSVHDEDTLFDTIAHEIGHVLVGPGHPDGGRGPAPLTGLKPIQHRQRLMCSGNVYRLGNLLVKAEWDKAEEWMKDNIDE